MTYTTPGQYIIQLSSSDSDGESSTWNLFVTVVDSMPLTWSTDGTNGDLDVVVSQQQPNFVYRATQRC